MKSHTYDASYDIWLNPTPITTGVNQQEVMIWFNHTGPIQPVGSVVGNATIDGQNFTVWKGSNGQNNVGLLRRGFAGNLVEQFRRHGLHRQHGNP